MNFVFIILNTAKCYNLNTTVQFLFCGSLIGACMPLDLLNLYTYPCPFWNRTTFLSDLVAGRNLTHVYFSHSVIATRIMYSSFSPTEHYENMPMQYTEIFKVVKNENFHQKKIDIFLIFAQNIDCGHTLEPSHRGGSNEYPQSMFWGKNKKNRYSWHTPVLLYKSGVQGGIHYTDMFS